MLDAPQLWHVIVTVAGRAQPLADTHEALRRLQVERPFTHCLRYGEGCAEISYWEEGPEVIDAASLALRLWNEHRTSAGLPSWKVIGLEVVEREAYLARRCASPVSVLDALPQRF